MSEKEVLELSETEKELITSYLKALSDLRTTLGVVREEYLAREKKLLELVSDKKDQFMSKVSTIAEGKGISLDSEKWAFDLKSFTYVKQQEDEV